MTEPVTDAKQRWDAYFWEPGGDVLRNKLDLHNSFDLRIAEYRLRAMRQGELDRGEVDIPRTFDSAHVQAIHRHLLQDVYDWAGEFRNVGISKNDQAFVSHDQVDELVDKIGEKLIRSQDWSAMNRQEFVENIAKVYAFQNMAHPFREGNGASSKVYLAHVAALSPYKLDFDRVDKWEWNQAAQSSYPAEPEKDPAPDPSKMYAVFDKLTVEREPAAVTEPDLLKSIELQNTTYTSAQPSGTGMGERPETHAVAGQEAGQDHGRGAG